MIDVNDGGARYFTVPLSNVWGTTMGIVDRTGSLNKAQSEPNADGTYTYVISQRRSGGAQLGRPVRAHRRASSRCGWRSSPTSGPPTAWPPPARW